MSQRILALLLIPLFSLSFTAAHAYEGKHRISAEQGYLVGGEVRQGTASDMTAPTYGPAPVRPPSTWTGSTLPA